MEDVDIEKLRQLTFLDKELRESTQQAEHLMPCIFGKTTDEDFNSDWLAYILNPQLNSLGVEPLNRLLELAKIKEKFNDSDCVEFEKPGEYHITREITLSENDRIDFLIRANLEGRDCIIAIENKVFSWLSKDNQLISYSHELETNPLYEKLKIFKIFLAPKKTIDSIPKKNLCDFLPVSHEDLVDELKAIPIDPINNLRASFLICEYIKNMEANILKRGNNMPISDTLIKFICENSYDINKVIEKRDQFFKELRSRIYEIVNERCFKEGYKYSGIDGNRVWCLWYREEWSYSSNIHYEVLFCDGRADKMFDEDGALIVRLCVHYEGKTPKFKDVQKEVSEKLKQRTPYVPTDEKLFKLDKYSPKADIIDVKLQGYYKITTMNDIEVLGNVLADEMMKIKDVYDEIIGNLAKPD